MLNSYINASQTFGFFLYAHSSYQCNHFEPLNTLTSEKETYWPLRVLNVPTHRLGDPWITADFDTTSLHQLKKQVSLFIFWRAVYESLNTLMSE